MSEEARAIGPDDHPAAADEQLRLTLTPREREILRLLATPRSPEEMASQLTLSKQTVRKHIAAIYRKLGVHSRSEAIAKGVELHLVDRSG